MLISIHREGKKTMLSQWNLKTILNNHDWRSKLTDGVLAAAVLFLLWLVVALAAHPIRVIFGLPGMLVYALGLMAVALFSFQQSLVGGRPDNVRAWYGIAGGLLIWSMIEVSGDLGLPVIPSPSGVIILIMVSLIVGLLWRNFLPVGARFFSLTILLNWAELLFMSTQEWLASFSPVFTLTYRATGYLAILAAFLTLGWILFHTRRRIQRVSGALAIWFMISLALYVFRGSLF